MDLDGTSRAIATEAWSQLVHSIISNSPPRDMSRDYYYTSAERGFNYLHKPLKRLERYKYKLGTKNIQTRMRYDMLSMQHENQQGIEHIRDCTRSGKHFQVLQPNEDGYQQGMEHIRYCLISSKHSELVQTNQDENVQGTEHIRECLRSSKHSELMRGNVDEDEQKNERNIPDSPRSVLHSQVVQPYEDEYQQGIEHIQYCLVSNKHSEMLQRNEKENQQGIGNIRDCLRSSKHYQVARANEDEDYQEIEHIPDAPGSSRDSEVMQVDDFTRSSKDSGVYIEHTRDSIKSTVSFKPTEYDDRQLINYIKQTGRSTQFDEYQRWNNYKEARKMSTLFDELLELIENGDLLREEKPTLPFQVLKVIKLIHHYGVDIIRRGVEKELEDVNLKCDEIEEEDMAKYYKKKGLEVMLRICDTEACQRTIYDIIGKAERHQVFFI